MVFNTIIFFQFLAVILLLFYCVPKQWRWAILLAGSYYFYMSWHPAYASLLAASTMIDYASAILISRSNKSARRLLWLCASLSTNLGMLFVFKYYNFFSDSVTSVSTFLGSPISAGDTGLLLPVGISFYTFQSLSYTIDVYRGRIEPERHIGIFALYVSFFPQLVAGPIERSETLLPQLRRAASFDYNRMSSGLRLIIWGLIKKLVVADRLAVLVNAVYGDPHSFHGFGYVIATFFFAYQIYCDFSGYSDIAIGTARLLGINLMKNFDRPYSATSVGEFWRKWHISLSTWLRDYLYFPLGGNRVSTPRWVVNVMITFLLSGLWHGASWTFVLWGFLHGLFVAQEVLLQKPRKWLCRRMGMGESSQIRRSLGMVTTFCLVTFAWIPFRANSLRDVTHIVTHLHTGWGTLFASHGVREFARLCGTTSRGLGVSLLLILALEILQGGSLFTSKKWQLADAPFWGRWACYYGLIAVLLWLGHYGPPQFIYFQF